MGIAERRLRQRDEVRASILATAWQIVREEGWQALSIRKIAEAIEYSIPVIYDHFANKEAILLEFGKDGYRSLSKKIAQAKAKSDDPAEQLHAMAHAYWNFAFKNKEYYQVMFGLGMACSEEEKYIPEKTEFRELMMQPIDAILEKNKKQAVNTCLKYHTFWSVLHGLVSIKLMGHSDVSDELNKMVLDDAVDGFVKNLGR